MRSSFVPLEPQLFLQQAVEGLAVLAAIAPVNSVVGAHDRRNTAMHRILERPQVCLVHGAVVDVRRDSLDGRAGDAAENGRVRSTRGVPLRLLLVANVVLCAGLEAGGLHALDCRGKELACQVRVG